MEFGTASQAPDVQTTITQAADGGAVAIAIAAFFNQLPNVAALLSVIWLALRIYESDTVQKLIRKWRKSPDDDDSSDA